MSHIILVTGPARSGKSEWAETLARESQRSVVYIATANHDSSDKEWQQRIQQHQQRRPAHWSTLEVPCELSHTLADAQPSSCILVDSLGTWVANYLALDETTWLNTVQDFLSTVELVSAQMIFVAEETGWGVVPAYPVGRTFRDRLGGLIRQLSSISDTVYLVTGGYVLNLSQLGSPLPNISNNS
ncbi:MAG: bifunctional adenosylcobinamide kinase/adenosylcobinamide-phosphate guanylyltransferase [Calothrix sp. MO_167.B42]|nr:bifunctional adenosylcobinamide kinase/adenosylcobinamide-phosphate guanylyltransferase [Calothrix sp. MO_167.B42]